MNKIAEILEQALNKNEFKEFLMGEGVYNIPSREGFITDVSAALHSGIYEYYQLYPEKNINLLFEQEIVNMLNGNNFETMFAFEYCWRQISCEERKTAPFKLSEQCLINIKASILAKADALKKYKDYVEFGSELESGAYQYIQNIDSILEEEYGRRLL